MTIEKSRTHFGKIIPSRNALVLIFGFFLIFGILLGILIVPIVQANGTVQLYAPETSSPPTLDGTLSPGEWSDARHYSFYFVPTSDHPPDYIDVFLMYAANFLYVAYDVQPDNTSDDSDTAYLSLDLNNNGTMDFYLAVSRDGLSPEMNLNGTHCSNLDWDAAFGFTTSPQETGRNHTIIEFKIGINTSIPYISQDASTLTHLAFGASPVGIVFGGYGTLSPTWAYGNSSILAYFNDLPAYMYADLYLLPEQPQPFPWWVFLVIGIPVVAIVVMFIYYRYKYDQS